MVRCHDGASRVYDGTVTRTQTTLCVVLVLALALVGISPARADNAPTIDLTLTSVTPDHVDPGAEQQVTVEGTVTNSSSVPLFWVDAQLWHYDGSLASFDLIDAAIDTDVDAPLGTRISPGQGLATTTALAPGAQAKFKLSVPVAALQLGKQDLAAIIGVQVRAATSEKGTRQTVGRSRVMLPRSNMPFDLVSINMITAPPGIRPDSASVTPQLRTTILDTLSGQLTRSYEDDVITLLDPAVYTATHYLATAKPRPSEDAQALLEQLDELKADGKIWLLPPGNPNLARLPESVRGKVVGWAKDLTPQPLEGAPSAVLTSDVKLAGKGFDHVVTYGTHADRLRFFRVGSDAKPTRLDDLPEPEQQTFLPPTNSKWQHVEEQLRTAEQRAQIRKMLTTDPAAEAPTDMRFVSLAAYSLDFPTEEDSLAYLETVPEVSFDPSTIEFSASPSFVMGERTSEFPTTIANPTRLPIWVRIAFHSDNPQRITVPDTDVVRVGPGESQTLRVKPAASSNGVTSVHAKLMTVDGTYLAPSADIEITSTEFGRVGWIIIIISGAVVLAGTVWRIRSVQRERSKESSESSQ